MTITPDFERGQADFAHDLSQGWIEPVADIDAAVKTANNYAEETSEYWNGYKHAWRESLNA